MGSLDSLFIIPLIIPIIMIPLFPFYLAFFWLLTREAKRFGPGIQPSLLSLTLYIVLASCGLIIINFFLSFSAKAKQSEAKTNLQQIYLLQQSYRTKTSHYAEGSNTFSLLGWEPRGQNRYAYYCGEDFIPNLLPAKNGYMGFPLPDPNHWPYTIRPGVTASGFTAMAIGNIDNDDFPDIWMISDQGKWTCLLDDTFNVMAPNILVAPTSWTSQAFHYLKFLIWLTPFPLTLLFLSVLFILFIINTLRDLERYEKARKRTSMEKL